MRYQFCRFLVAGLILAGSSGSLTAQDSLATRARQQAVSGNFRQAALTWRLLLAASPDNRCG